MRNMMKTIPFAIAIGMVSMANVAQASDGSIQFNGIVVSHTCTVAVNGVVSPAAASVTLPTVSTSTLTAAGMSTGRTNFEIELSNCTNPGKAVSAFFEAGADVDSTTGNLINRGSATNVSLQLVDNASGANNGSVIKAGDSSQVMGNSVAFVSGTGAATLPYAVQYYATGAVGSGSVQSTITYSINYN